MTDKKLEMKRIAYWFIAILIAFTLEGTFKRGVIFGFILYLYFHFDVDVYAEKQLEELQKQKQEAAKKKKKEKVTKRKKKSQIRRNVEGLFDFKM